MAVSPEVQENGRVRAQMRQVVGDLENVLGELKTVVGDLRVLVTQIDAVTDKIDRKCVDEDAKGHRRRLSAPVHVTLTANERSPTLRHSVSHSCDMGRRKSAQLHSNKRSPDTSRGLPRAQSSNKSLSSNLQHSQASGKVSPNPSLRSQNSNKSKSKHSSQKGQLTDITDNNNSSTHVNFNVDKYQLLPVIDKSCSKDKKKTGSSSTNSSGYATRVVGKRRKIGPKLALSLPSTDVNSNSKVDSTSQCSFTDQDSNSDITRGNTRHVHCSPCSPIPSKDYCGIYERELDLKLELDLEFDEMLEVYSTIGSSHQREQPLCGLPVAPPYDHDINTWTQYTVDFTNSNHYRLQLGDNDGYGSDTASDVMSSDDINMRIIPKTLNTKFVNYNWRTVVKP